MVVLSDFLLSQTILQYGLLLSLIVILQIAAAITGFTLITRTDGIVWNSLNSMMSRGYWHSEYVTADKTMDWIQQTVFTFRKKISKHRRSAF